jgi:hypothetical protein
MPGTQQWKTAVHLRSKTIQRFSCFPPCNKATETRVNESDSSPGITGDPFESIPEIDGPVKIGFCPFSNGYAQWMSDKPNKAFHGYSLSVMKS